MAEVDGLPIFGAELKACCIPRSLRAAKEAAMHSTQLLRANGHQADSLLM